MNITKPANPSYEFYFPEVDTLARVENAEGMVIIRTSRDTFSERRKACFVRELAAEGFIPDTYQWFSSSGADSFLGVRWLVDISWLQLPVAVLAGAHRFMRRLFTVSFVFWCVLMVVLFQGWLGRANLPLAQPSSPPAALVTNASEFAPESVSVHPRRVEPWLTTALIPTSSLLR
jgi:hypothetical protein